MWLQTGCQIHVVNKTRAISQESFISKFMRRSALYKKRESAH